jgi:hypothetical protein
MQTLLSKRFVIRKSLIGKNQIIKVEFNNHDIAYEIMREKLEAMACFAKYKSYTSSTNLPLILRDKQLV